MGPTLANRSYTGLRSRFAKAPTPLSVPLRQHIGWASGTPPHTGTPLTAQGGWNKDEAKSPPAGCVFSLSATVGGSCNKIKGLWRSSFVWRVNPPPKLLGAPKRNPSAHLALCLQPPSEIAPCKAPGFISTFRTFWKETITQGAAKHSGRRRHQRPGLSPLRHHKGPFNNLPLEQTLSENSLNVNILNLPN